MLAPWLLVLVAFAVSQEVKENSEDTSLKTTTLYPVANKTAELKNNKNLTEAQLESKSDVIKDDNAKENRYEEDKVEVTSRKKERVTTWTIDANYAQPKEQSRATYIEPESKVTQAIHLQAKAKEDRLVYGRPKDKETQGGYISAKDKHSESEDSNSTDSKEKLAVERPKNKEEEFKPSPHLGSVFDDENLNLLKFTTSGPSAFAGNKPATDFFGSKDYYMLNYKSPKDTYRDQIDAPYRFDSHFLTNNWKHLESKPTVESSVKIPAGGLYKQPNPFKDKPSSDSDDDFGIGFSEDGRENPIRKRSNPWKHLVQLVTAFLPVGLIISALTPSVITLHTTNNEPTVSRWRRSRAVPAAPAAPAVPAVSEACRRRLLCELHSEENYLQPQDNPGFVRKHCYKLRCEDPAGLARVLAWLLAHRRPPPPAAHRWDHTRPTNYRQRSNSLT